MKNFFLMLCCVMLLSLTADVTRASDSGTEPVAAALDAADEKTDEFEDDFEDEFENGAGQSGPLQVADPLYPLNYAMFTINDVLFVYALEPFSQVYKAILPTPVRTGINNFFHNLMFPVRFVNNLLQGRLEKASDEVGIFLVNSTVGILGFNQFAQKHLDMKTQDEDLGQTLGSWSIGEGFYLYLPLLGPTSLRDAVGAVGDYFITPVNYVSPWELEWGLKATDKINATSFRIEDYNALKEASVDPYIAFRNAYIQYRRSAIND